MIDVSDLLGKRYVLHGRGPDGYDCYGLVMEVEKRYGNMLPDFDYCHYTSEFFRERTMDVLDTGHPVRVDGFVEGALLLFEGSSGIKDHIGVYLGNGEFIHCNRYGVNIGKVSTLENKKMEIYVWQS